MSFDGNGRMYVVEMRSYMQDADGSNSRAPVSRISRHEDTDGDGAYDRHTVFVDKMVLPRMAFPLDDGVIIALETDNRDMYRSTDTNGDGVADRKGALLRGRRACDEHGVAAERPDVGARQLAVHDLQPVPAPDPAGRQAAARGNRTRTADSGAPRRTTTGSRGSWTAVARSVPSISRRRLPTARSTSRTTSRKDSGCRGRRPAASATCRAACGGSACRKGH